jgi:hypothetical protein
MALQVQQPTAVIDLGDCCFVPCRAYAPRRCSSQAAQQYHSSSRSRLLALLMLPW